LLETDGKSKIETVAMKQGIKEMRTKSLWTVVKYEKGLESGTWALILGLPIL